MNTFERSRWIKNQAHELGFDACGISTARRLDEEEARLTSWLQNGMHGKMQYMENHFEMRLDPRLLVPGAQSVISLSFNYYPKQSQSAENTYKIAKYAYGEDYHFVVKERVKELLSRITEKFGAIEGRCFVDSAPVMERTWAANSGLGWIGKNTLLLTKARGSYQFLAELICDLQLEADGPVKDYCGSCTKCIDACPTQAIHSDYTMDGSKCISYFTIELKEEIPKGMEDQFENWMFGCDICQDVCPINSRAKVHNEPRFEANSRLLEMTKTEWKEITEEVFNELFKKSSVKRTKFAGLKRNIEYLSKHHDRTERNNTQ